MTARTGCGILISPGGDNEAMIHMMSRAGMQPALRAVGPRIVMPMLLSVILALAGCAETQLAGAVLKDVSRSETPTGAGGYWKVGNPYKIAGDWYYPKDDPNYDSVGIASWYGPNFHKKKTANGEIFDMYKVSAAHPTLPMPIIARVTNLSNGRSLIVRVNDRGPFAHDREIDMSMRAAELLGFKEQGTTKVRVQYLSRAADWKGEQGLQTAQQQPVAPVKPSPAVAAAATTQMQPIRDDAEDDDDSGIATAGLPPAPMSPMDVSLLASTAVAGASAPAAVLPSTPSSAPVVQPSASQTTAMAPITDNFFVQAGSFRSAGNANSLASQLSDLGPVEVKETLVDGTPWYRVRVGPVDNAPGADTLLESVISRGQNGARVVIN